MNHLAPFAAQGRFIFSQGKRWMANLTDDHRALQPMAGMKTAGWLVGHLAVTGDFGRRICGLTPICSKEWRALFNPGTFPSLEASVYPPMPVLLEACVSVYRDFFANAPQHQMYWQWRTRTHPRSQPSPHRAILRLTS